MSVRRRLRNLEARTPRPVPARSGPTTLDEIRALETDITRLEAEILAAGGTVEPSSDVDLQGDLEGIEREIERLEREAAADG